MTLPSSYRAANDHEDGPFRAVVAVSASRTPAGSMWTGSTGRVSYSEVLACGHMGNLLGWRLDDDGPVWPPDRKAAGAVFAPTIRRARAKRRCISCRSA